MNEQDPDARLSLDQALALRRNGEAQETGQASDTPLKLVIFELGGERFAFPGDCIREIIFQAEVFFVPGCPESLEGVINVRGDITTVIRLEELLALPRRPPGQPGRSSILLGQGQAMTSGIRVGQVIDVVDIPSSSVQPAPATLPEQLRQRMPGVLYFQNRAVTLLDLDRLFADYARGLG